MGPVTVGVATSADASVAGPATVARAAAARNAANPRRSHRWTDAVDMKPPLSELGAPRPPSDPTRTRAERACISCRLDLQRIATARQRNQLLMKVRSPPMSTPDAIVRSFMTAPYPE